ncbi:MAG: hypothetical protein E7028_08115 [Planctomycetaceae bacterium]|nr:hypothetical protein [Planctomycetaceae bacterium]MBQ2821890.1 hypothetical protein [Thermoguttaceae bacterium]
MSKILCLFSLVLSVILMVVFILDLSMKVPFKGESMMFDIVFLTAALVLGVLSVLTFREQ